MASFDHPMFESGARVALVQMLRDKTRFGVAMAGGRYVVALPEGYDGRTAVHWVQGWIIVTHPDLPPLLADTSTGRTGPMNEHAMQAAMAAYIPPASGVMRLH